MESKRPLLPVFLPTFLSKAQLISIALLLVYFIMRFPLVGYLDQLGQYASYVFEFVFVFAVWVVFRKRVSFRIQASFRLGIDAGLMLACGFGVYKLATPLNLTIPFNLKTNETLFFLLIIGPILEELIFRMAHWELLSELFNIPIVLLLVTSVIFSFSHFFAWWHVPGELQSFIIYQTIYTFGLATYCGLRRIQTQSVSIPILVHFFFNAGFYIGFVM